MELTNKEIIQAIDSLNLLAEKELTVSLSFKIAKTIKVLTGIYEAYLSTLEPIKEDREKVMALLDIKNNIEITPFSMEEIEQACQTLTPQQAFGLEVLIDG